MCFGLWKGATYSPSGRDDARPHSPVRQDVLPAVLPGVWIELWHTRYAESAVSCVISAAASHRGLQRSGGVVSRHVRSVEVDAGRAGRPERVHVGESQCLRGGVGDGTVAAALCVANCPTMRQTSSRVDSWVTTRQRARSIGCVTVGDRRNRRPSRVIARASRMCVRPAAESSCSASSYRCHRHENNAMSVCSNCGANDWACNRPACDGGKFDDTGHCRACSYVHTRAECNQCGHEEPVT